MKRDGLVELVDGFGRTADAPFILDELIGFLEERTGTTVDEHTVFDLASSSCYLFESWTDPLATKFIPRRRFFQAAEFLIAPTKEEIQEGIFFPGHRFMPFICRDVFPADVWLVLDDGSAPHVKRVDFPKAWADDALRFFGRTHAADYLESDHPKNKGASGNVAVSVFDLQDFYLQNNFKDGDYIKVRVLDWLQGVLSLSYVSADATVEGVSEWLATMRTAYRRMQDELGMVGDCYEQLAIMMLLGEETGSFPLMKDPPLSLSHFITRQPDIMLHEAGDRAVLCPVGIDLSGVPVNPLKSQFKEMGLPVTEAEAEAYMRDSLFHGAGDSDNVLARLSAGRSLIFRSLARQEEFHRRWDELWGEVLAEYSLDADSHGQLRSDLLLLKDRCISLARELEAGMVDPRELAKKPEVREFSLLSASLSRMLVLLNVDRGNLAISGEELERVTSTLFRELPEVLDTIKGQ